MAGSRRVNEVSAQVGGRLGQAPSWVLEPQAPVLCVSTGPGGPPADGGAGGSHRRGLAPGEPCGRSAALPVPGLAGLRDHAQLLRLAGQPRPARRPEAGGVRCRPRGLWLLPGGPWGVVASHLRGHHTCESVSGSAQGHHWLRSGSRLSPHPGSSCTLCAAWGTGWGTGGAGHGVSQPNKVSNRHRPSWWEAHPLLGV